MDENNNYTPSLSFLILSDLRIQNKRLFLLLISSLGLWLLTILAFVGYITYDRWYDAQVETTETVYQTQNDVRGDIITNSVGDTNGK